MDQFTDSDSIGRAESPGHISVATRTKRSIASSRHRAKGMSSASCKEFLRKFVDSQILTENLEEWLIGLSKESGLTKTVFGIPFGLPELQTFDYALESVSFQQLFRMPNALYRSSGAVEATAHIALEDFLHASLKGLWETFWGHEKPMPFTVACMDSSSSKFYSAEKAIANGKLEGICATAVLMKSNKSPNGKWDEIVELALLKPDVRSNSRSNTQLPSLGVLGEAIFFALRVLLARRLSRSSVVLGNSNCIFVLLADFQYGGLVKVEGDLSKLKFDDDNVYKCAAAWIQMHAKITVSPVDRIWNKLGNANWGDIGTLEVLLATFHSMARFCGMPNYLPENLAAQHSARLQIRRTERQLVDKHVDGARIYRFQQQRHSPEIIELQEESLKLESQETFKLEKGSVLWIEDDSECQRGYEINDVVIDSETPVYSASCAEEPGKALLLFLGLIPSVMDFAWEDVNLRYQVQRQAKILGLMKQKGISSKYLPEIVASGRIVHPGQCNKSNSEGKCFHPWCGTPILITYPAGETVYSLIRKSIFRPDEVLRCCHDCLSALSAASSAGIRHGDICPQTVISLRNGMNHPYFVLIGWGHAVLEDMDHPSMNLFFSSTNALQDRKLCASSDAESLIYLLYFASGGLFPELESIEGALQWREKSWSRRVIQQKLGEVSPVLKAFADYVDSLCGTPYLVDYEIWLRRLRRTISEDQGKVLDMSK